MSDPITVLANTVPEAYEGLKNNFIGLLPGVEVNNFTVHVRKPDFTLPETYYLSSEQVKSLAEKWRSRSLPRDSSMYFTHGQRIYDYGSKYNRNTNQLENIVQLLKGAPHKRRAVISLLDPTIDTIQLHDTPIPSLNIIQFYIEGGSNSISLTAYYKAQEMCKFWIINMTEVLLLLDEVIKRLRDEMHIKYSRGSITTHATIAYWDKDFSLLERPLIERNKDRLFGMIYNIFIKDSRESTRELIEYFNDSVRSHSHVEASGFEKMILSCGDIYNTSIQDEKDPEKRCYQEEKIRHFMHETEMIKNDYLRLRDLLADRDPESEQVRIALREKVSMLCSWLESLTFHMK